MLWIFVTFFLNFSFAHGAVSLKDAFQSARINMESLKRATTEITRREELRNQARGAVLPTISGVGNYTRIDRPTAANVNRAFVLTKQYSAAIRMQQTLIRGGVYENYQLRQEDVLLAEFQKNATELSLYQLVISSYFNLYNAKIDLKSLEELLKYSHERVKELSSRAKVGRSRKGELVQAEAQLLTAESQHRNGLMSLHEAEKNFEFYTKIKSENLADLPNLPKELPKLTELLDKMKKRPDLMARLQEVQVADKRVGVAKGGHYPTVDLVGNYYIDRTGVLATSEWDLGVQVSIPFFQGGVVAAQVRESVEAKRIAELNSFENIRASERDLAVLYQNYLQIQEQLKTLREALKKAEEAWKLSLQDYRFGQITNLDVIQTMNLYIETKRSFNNLLVLAHMTHKNLEAGIGVLP